MFLFVEPNMTISIKGKLLFPNKINMLQNKCLTLRLIDYSIADVDGFVVVTTSQNLTYRIVNGTEMEYNLVSPKPAPKDLARSYTLSVLIDEGLCYAESYKDYKLRKYRSATLNHIDLAKNETSTFVKDIVMDGKVSFLYIILFNTKVDCTIGDKNK